MSGPVTAETIAEASLETAEASLETNDASAEVYEPEKGFIGGRGDIESASDLVPVDPDAPPPLTEEELQAFLAEPQYDFRHAVLVQQKRRMRSGEVHYIDHPLLGILVKVSRYEFEPFVDTEAEQSIAGTRR